MKIIDWIKKNAIEGANFAEAEELLLNESIDGLTKKEQVMELMVSNSVFKAAKDSVIGSGVDSYIKTFEADKLPELKKQMREDAMKEANPELTADQKEMKAIRLELETAKEEKRQGILKDSLLSYGKELYGKTAFDPDRIKAYAAYGDKAKEMLLGDFDSTQVFIKNQVDEITKGKFTTKTPVSGDLDKSKSILRSDFNVMNSLEQRNFIKDGGIPVDE